MGPKERSSALVAVLLAASLVPAAHAQVPEGDPTDLPVLSKETPRGSGAVESTTAIPPVAKTVDGDISDWVGEASRYGGTALYSGGELVYQDHLFDAHGPDDGRDAQRFATTDLLEAALPETYRVDALGQADVSGELGVPIPEQFAYDDSYGDAADHQDAADLHEVRVAMDSERLALLARTTTMTSEGSTALLVLADTAPGETSLEVPFNSGLASSIADTALFIADGTVRVADLATGDVAPLADAVAVANPQGWTNAIEASLPLDAIGGSAQGISLAVASGIVNESGDGFAHLSIETTDDLPHANVANVAFRLDEPVRVWFEKKQGLSLFEGSIDPFFYELDASAMQAGTTQRYVPGPGYHERIFVSDTSTGVPREGGRDGVFQHYGIFLPSAYEGDPVPLQWWLHWRGGNAHSGASIVPKVFKQFGEDRDSIVVAPSGRGTSTWYVGRGHVDVLEVWADVFDTFAVDRDRVYVSGHSMGGWGSYLLTLLYPDRFAAAAPVAGPVTQGAWTGLDFPGCDDFESDGTTPCYVSVNGGRGRDQHTRKILENARHVPYAILQGTDDELVWYSGVFRQSERLIELGYRHRLYSYPGYEHYSHPIADQWAEAASYLHSFVRDANPAQISYKRDMLFERATEEVQAGNAVLDFDFDSAYWMSELTATDAGAGTASFEGRSLAIPEEPYIAAPDTGAPTAPGQTGPYAITGLQWLPGPTAATPEPVNGFEVTLTGADAVRLDLARMSIDPSATIAGAVNTGNDLDLRLDAGWIGRPEVLIDGERVNFFWNHELLTVSVPAGSHSVTIQDRRHGHDR